MRPTNITYELSWENGFTKIMFYFFEGEMEGGSMPQYKTYSLQKFF